MEIAIDFERTDTAEAVADAARAIYRIEPGPLDRLTHVQATVERDGRLEVFRIGASAPKSACDRFVLGYARARASAIVTSGAILRAEPSLSYDLDGPGRSRAGLAAWRRRHFDAAPRVLVLTRDPSLPFDHPIFGTRTKPVVFTHIGVARGMHAPEGVEIVGVERPTVEAAIGWLARRAGEGILVELGPSASRSLYSPTIHVGEVLLSIFRGPALEPSAIAGALFDRRFLAQEFTPVAEPTKVVEPSGVWEFGRYRRTQLAQP
jgi:riboflavin biosynthesis pyrimidine reductase